jgi:hypothetical protein
MSVEPKVHLEATANELAAAEADLLSTLDATPDDESATERIAAATARLRIAQARHTAARSGVPHLPDLIGWG